jgi:hypothetical protein
MIKNNIQENYLILLLIVILLLHLLLMGIRSPNKKRIINIILFIDIIFLIIAVSYVDYIVILNDLHYEASRAEKLFGIEITITNNIPIEINRAFEAIAYQIQDLLEIQWGSLKDRNNADLAFHLRRIWYRLDYCYMSLAYSTKYTKYLFFIFNYLNYKLSLATVYFIIKSVILSIICIIIYKRIYR